MLKDQKDGTEMPKSGKSFTNLVDGNNYVVEIVDDPEEVKRMAARPPGSFGIKLSDLRDDAAAGNIKKKTAASSALTDELKSMSHQQLMEKGERYKELLEARELEDVLYS